MIGLPSCLVNNAQVLRDSNILKCPLLHVFCMIDSTERQFMFVLLSNNFQELVAHHLKISANSDNTIKT